MFPAGADTPALLFLRGGYWRIGEKEDRRFPATIWAPRGVAWIVPNYRLAPETSLPDIIGDTQASLDHVVSNAESCGIDRTQIHLVGNSAGAHLAAMLAARNAPGKVASLTLVSGLYDLLPLLDEEPNDWLNLDAGSARAMSPIHHLPPPDMPVTVCCGGAETGAFRLQSLEFAEALRANGNPVDHFESPGRNHMEVITEVGTPGTPVFAALERQLEEGRDPVQERTTTFREHCLVGADAFRERLEARMIQERAVLRPLARPSSTIMSLALSAIMFTAAFVLPEMIAGITEASTTLNPWMPLTRHRSSSGPVAPMETEPTGWKIVVTRFLISSRSASSPRAASSVPGQISSSICPLIGSNPQISRARCNPATIVLRSRSVAKSVCPDRWSSQWIGGRQPDLSPALRSDRTDRDREARKRMEAFRRVVARPRQHVKLDVRPVGVRVASQERKDRRRLPS